MPLALDCVCAGSMMKICEVSSLTFKVTEYEMPYGTARLLGGPSAIDIIGVGDYELTPNSSWTTVWDDLYFYATAERSLPSDADDGFKIVFYIEAVFNCEDEDSNRSTFTIKLMNQDTDYDTCFDEVLRAYGSISRGIFAGAIISSGPLAACQGFEVQAGMFDDEVNLQVVDVSGAEDGTVCLCPSGSSATPFAFMLTEGRLPSGVTLNTATGCLEGEVDGLYGPSSDITFTVWDADRPPNEASITCRFLFCPPHMVVIRNSAY